MRQALIVWGGWEGHEPRQGAEVIQAFLEEDGFDVRLENLSWAPLGDSHRKAVPA